MWKKSLTKYVYQIKCDNFRIQVTKFNFPTEPLLIINTYFPWDPQINNFDDTELIDLILDIKSQVEISGCANVLLVVILNV